MKKLTAGIFTVLMGLVTVNAAEAFVASKGYVDEKVGGATTSIATLTQTVADNKTAAETAIAAAQKAGDDAAAALESYKTSNDAAVTALDGRLDTVEEKAASDAMASKGYTDSKVKELADGAVATNTAAIAAINNADTGILKQAQTYADTAEADAIAAAAEAAKIYIDETELTTSQNAQNASIKEAYEAADKTITDSIGEIAEGKTVVEMIADAQTAATYDDTAVKAGIKANADAIDAINDETTGILAGAKAYTDTEIGKIDTAYKAADTAINTKIGTVATGETVVGLIADAQEQADKGVEDAATAQAAADAAQATANAAIPAPTGPCQDAENKCVLTYNNTEYTWEVIERATDATLEN